MVALTIFIYDVRKSPTTVDKLLKVRLGLTRLRLHSNLSQNAVAHHAIDSVIEKATKTQGFVSIVPVNRKFVRDRNDRKEHLPITD